MKDRLEEDYISVDTDFLLMEKQIKRKKMNLLLLIGFYFLLAFVSFIVI